MKLWVFSDLHLEYADLSSPLAVPEADVCVVAGDLMRAPANGVHWLAQHVIPAMPCIYFAGNHEFYRGGIKECLEDGRAAAECFPDVHFLEDKFIIVGGVRFIGATLWTDFRIDGAQHLSMHHARERMNDYRRIALQRSPWQRFVPAAACRIHQESRRFIEETLKADRDIPTVVVSHHLPSMKSPPACFDRELNGANASNLEDVIEDGRPALWVHGHTHDSCDYTLGRTRVVCKPRGYADENAAFHPQLVVERQPLILLDDDIAEIGGVLFIGGTLWTDFRMGLEQDADLRPRMEMASRRLADFSQIRLGDGELLSPQVMLGFHILTYGFIERQLAIPFDGKKVVVTHNLPHPDCTPEIYRGSDANYLFACSEHVFGDILDSDVAPSLWVCGHTHHPVDVTVGKTRIVCNPRGYMRVRDERENGFRWDLVIDTVDLP